MFDFDKVKTFKYIYDKQIDKKIETFKVFVDKLFDSEFSEFDGKIINFKTSIANIRDKDIKLNYSDVKLDPNLILYLSYKYIFFLTPIQLVAITFFQLENVEENKKEKVVDEFLNIIQTKYDSTDKNLKFQIILFFLLQTLASYQSELYFNFLKKLVRDYDKKKNPSDIRPYVSAFVNVIKVGSKFYNNIEQLNPYERTRKSPTILTCGNLFFRRIFNNNFSIYSNQLFLYNDNTPAFLMTTNNQNKKQNNEYDQIKIFKYEEQDFSLCFDQLVKMVRDKTMEFIFSPRFLENLNKENFPIKYKEFYEKIIDIQNNNLPTFDDGSKGNKKKKK